MATHLEMEGENKSITQNRKEIPTIPTMAPQNKNQSSNKKKTGAKRKHSPFPLVGTIEDYTTASRETDEDPVAANDGDECEGAAEELEVDAVTDAFYVHQHDTVSAVTGPAWNELHVKDPNQTIVDIVVAVKCLEK